MWSTGYPFKGTRGMGQSTPLTADHPTYETVQQVRDALNAAGFEACELIVGVDFTKSNKDNGKSTFGGRSLHSIEALPNPYTAALQLVAKTLDRYDDDHEIPCYGFGDVTSSGRSVFSFFPGKRPAKGLEALLQRYPQIAPEVFMSGPTNFAPLIRQAMRDVYNSGMRFHILLILADGQISQECLEETKAAIREATQFPMSIVMIGIGDGPWDDMDAFDHSLPEREWDNFKFVQFNRFASATSALPENTQKDEFELALLEELPSQFRHARQLTGDAGRSAVEGFVNHIPDSILIECPPQCN